eukprot:999487-Rhodomonas_salina.2
MVTGLDPANGPTIGGTHVTILGENFGYEADKSIGAKLDNIPCSSVRCEIKSLSAARSTTHAGAPFDFAGGKLRESEGLGSGGAEIAGAGQLG